MSFNPVSVPQAGAIAFRFENGEPQVMLVRAKRNPGHWIFPKGHIESGESEESAALRELVEEAGIKGEIIRCIGHRMYERAGVFYDVSYFLTRFSATVNQGEAGRTPSWYTIGEAMERLSFSDMRGLLQDCIGDMR